MDDLGSPTLAQPEVGRRIWRRGAGQMLSLAAAFLCYGSAVTCLTALWFCVGDLGRSHPVTASLGASVVFFVGAGVVLHVMGLADLPSLRFDREDRSPRES